MIISCGHGTVTEWQTMKKSGQLQRKCGMIFRNHCLRLCSCILHCYKGCDQQGIQQFSSGKRWLSSLRCDETRLLWNSQGDQEEGYSMSLIMYSAGWKWSWIEHKEDHFCFSDNQIQISRYLNLVYIDMLCRDVLDSYNLNRFCVD